jgi:hypothetical protein
MILLKNIINEINKEFKVDLFKTRNIRSREIVILRFFYFKLARNMTDFSLTTIGNELKKKHGCVINGIKKFDYLILIYPDYVVKFNNIEIKLKYIKDKNINNIVDDVSVLKIELKKEKYKNSILEYEYKKIKKENRAFDNKVNKDILFSINKVHDSNFDVFLTKLDALCELNKHEIRRR